VLAEVARDDAAIEIVAAACGVADDDRDGASRKQLLDRLGAAGVGRKQQKEEN
jgi:hypothetical protein